eukprot:tig00021795_g23520.t1
MLAGRAAVFTFLICSFLAVGASSASNSCLRNVARGRGEVLLSEPAEGSNAGHALDGEIVAYDTPSAAVARSARTLNPRWMVDLKQLYDIELVEIWLVRPGCEDPAAPAGVRCSGSERPPDEPLHLALLGMDGEKQTEAYWRGGAYVWAAALEGPVAARFVQVQGPGAERALALAEVRAFARVPGPCPAEPGPAPLPSSIFPASAPPGPRRRPACTDAPLSAPAGRRKA